MAVGAYSDSRKFDWQSKCSESRSSLLRISLNEAGVLDCSAITAGGNLTIEKGLG